MRREMLWVLVAACHTPTYFQDVEPILQERCAGCHREGGIAPFALAGVDDARAHARAIAHAVEARTMPPWPPSEEGLPLLHSRALSQQQIDTVQRWVNAGAPLGPLSAHVERAPIVQTMTPTVTLAMSEAYTPSETLDDDYRCFVLDPHFASDVFVTGHDIHPGLAASVHHVILYTVGARALATLEALDAADPGPGYTCFGGPMIEASDLSSGLGFLGGWAPGGGAQVYPPGTGIRVAANSRIVMQVHYNTHYARGADITTAHLQTVPSVLKQAIVLPIAESSFVIPAGAAHFASRYALQVPKWLPTVRAWAVFPHMHVLGREIRLDLQSGGTSTRLIDIPRWDFHWQGQYEFAEPVVITPGDNVQLECVWDNSEGTQPVTWGEGTSDEMCLAFFYLTL